MKIRHTGIVVRNLDNALFFWRDLLGFKVEVMMDESGREIDAILGLQNVHVTTVKMSAPEGGMIELLNFHSHPDKELWNGKPYSTGITHIALTVHNLDLIYEQLIEAGFNFPNKPQYSRDGNVKVIYCQGPENLLVEFVENL